MANSPVVGTGPVELMGDQGQQLSIPLTDLFFDAKGKIQASRWPLYNANKAAVDPLLTYLAASGALYPAPQPAPIAALKISAIQPGALGNNIELTFTNSGTSDANDPTKFDAELIETDSYTGLTKDTVEGTLGTAAGAGLVFVTLNSAKGRPKNGSYPMAGLAAPFKVEILEADGATAAFEIEARAANDEAKYTNVVVSGVNANDANDPHFTLAASWQKSVVGIQVADLQNSFAYEITVANPPGGNQLGMPGNGKVTLRGGSDPAQSTTATAIVTSGG